MTVNRLRIALLAHIRHPIARPFMGGMEAHAWHLANALVARGHDVTLFASGDSETMAKLHPVVSVHYDRDLPWHQFHGTERLTSFLDRAFEGIVPALQTGDFDVIHNNTLHRLPPTLARDMGLPMVTSLHVPPFKLLADVVRASAAPWTHFTVCSQRQRAAWWSHEPPPEAHVVPNGIMMDDWPFSASGNGIAVWSGRITPTKGAHVAIDAARALGLDLTLYGVIEHRDYFETEVAPRLGQGIAYGGHLEQTALAKEVGRASLCLFTPLWDEPFGLVAAEAMMCGTPVAALPNGAVTEVVGPGGAIASTDTAEALALAGARALQLSRANVAAYARAAFSMDRMVADYETLYTRAIAGRPNHTPSQTIRRTEPLLTTAE